MRTTIRKDRNTQSSLGIAYIEFADKESGIKAKHLNESLFKGRQLTVMAKRKNMPGRGRGGNMGFNGRGGGNPVAMMMQMMRGFSFPRGGRGGGRGMAPGGFRGGRGGRGGRGDRGGPGAGGDANATQGQN